MSHDLFLPAIHELTDGTIGPIRRAELMLHLETCDACRKLAEDLARVRDLGQTLDRPAPPDRVWQQVAARLRQEGRLTPQRTLSARRLAPLAIAASLLLIVAASLFLLYRNGGDAPPQQATGNAAPADPVEAYRGVETEFRLAEQHYQNAITRLQQAARSDDAVIDPQTAAVLQKNLQVIDQAIEESRAALRSEPQSAPARDSLFDALRRKVVLLQDTIALMNQMRKGDAAGAAEIVDGGNNKS